MSNKLIADCKIGKNTKIWDFVNLYGCEIGDNCMIGAFVEIQKGAKIGSNVRIQSHTFICEGVTIEDDVFVGHGVVFINNKYPSMNNYPSNIRQKILIKNGASIGSNSTILPVTIGKNSVIGAGAVVTKDVPDNMGVVGNPAKTTKEIIWNSEKNDIKK